MKTKALLLVICAVLLSDTGSVSAVLPSVSSGTLYLHLDPSTLGLSNGDPVTSWTDSVNGSTFTNTAGTPSYVASYSNGLPAVAFDGVDDFMQAASLGGTPPNTGTITAFCVANFDAPAATNDDYLFSAQSGKTSDDRLGVNTDRNGSLEFRVGDGTTVETVAADINLRIYILVSGQSGNAVKLLIDNAEVGAGDCGSTPAALQELGLGAFNESGKFHGDVNIAEFVIYDGALDNVDITAVYQSLETKYGLARVLTSDPNVINGDFEVPVCEIEDEGVTDWIEAGGYNNFSWVVTRHYNTGGFNYGVGSGDNCVQIVSPYDCIYQAVATFSPNTMYEVTCWIGKKGQRGPVGRVELWAGGTPPILDDDDSVNYYGSEGFQLTTAGATLVDSASFDFSYLESTDWSPGYQTFILQTQTSHTASDPLYLLFLRSDADPEYGGQLAVDDVSMSRLMNPILIVPPYGATGLPITTDDLPDDPNHTTLAWSAPSGVTYEGYDIYFGTTEPNLSVADYGMTKLSTKTTATHIDPSPASDLEYETAYYWVVEAYDPNAIPNAENYSTFTTRVRDLMPVVTINQDGGRTWLGAPAVALDAVVTDPEEAIADTDWSVTTVPGSYADYLGDPNQFIISEGGTFTAPTALFAMNLTDPNALGYYVLTLTATDDEGMGPALTGSDTVYVMVHETACEAFQANGDWLSPFDDDDNCVLDLTDAAAWFAAWLEDRNPSDPIVYWP